MHNLAMSSTEHNLWTIANILGLVVVVAVAALLSLLIYLVKVIDRRVVQVRDTLKAAAANTADTVLIPQVAGGVEAVLAEGLQHHLFLGRVLERLNHDDAGHPDARRHRPAGGRPGVLPVLGRNAAPPASPGTWRSAASLVRTIVSHAELIGADAWSTSTRPAAWSPARCRCCTGWPRRSSRTSPPGPKAPAVPGARPALGTRRSRLHDAVGFRPGS